MPDQSTTISGMRGQAGNEHRTPGLTRIERTDPGHPAIQVARQLISYLLESRAWKVGDKLPSERELVGTFGVGRSAVREALKSLSLLGLLEIRQGDGTYVRSPHSDLLPQVMEWGSADRGPEDR